MKNVSKILIAVLSATLLFSCAKENLSDAAEVQDAIGQEKRNSFISVSPPPPKMTICFTTADGFFDLSSHFLSDFPPFSAGGNEGTLDAGVACFLEEQELCDEALTDQEVVTFDTTSYPDFDICDIYCQSGAGGSISNDEQEVILTNALALANANAPICPATGEPKVVSDIDFAINFTLGIPGTYFLDMHVEYSCCSPEAPEPNCPTAMYAQGLADGEVVTVTSAFGVVTTFTTTDYTTLATGVEYTFDIPTGATVTICSCGENYTTLTGGPSGVTFTTSNNPTSYSMCAF